VGLDHLTFASYLRLGLGAILPTDLTRVIYLDCDLVVLRDLHDLWVQPMEGALVLAARNFDNTLASMIPNAGALGLPAGAPSFNSGVLVVDLAPWRASNLDEVLARRLAENITHVPFGDQDVLHAVLHNRWHPLEPRWNWLCFEPSPEGETAFVYHDCWKNKPWIDRNDCPERHLDEGLLARTPWRRHAL
jgi:lipopolysaccharide biosynthesis glycosyltransferase